MARLEYLVKKRKRSVLSKIVDFFQHSEYQAYLVGGYIRDFMLHRKSLDIDFVVERNSIKAANELNSRLKGDLTIHKEFGTASLQINNLRIDFASARGEYYPQPGLLPKVYPATILEDLRRRDFTINAIAIAISKNGFGKVIDPFNGIIDIKKKIIRVLHKNSFIDDPTRIFRALRYKNRLNFELEPETEKLLKDAVDKKMINHLTGQRVLNEIRLIFGEKTYLKTLYDISKYRIYNVKREDLQILPLLGKERIYFYLAKLNTQKFPLKKREEKIIKDIKNLKTTIRKLTKATTESEIYYLLSGLSPQTIEIISCLQPNVTNKIKVYNKIKAIKPLITGTDLKNIGVKPGPSYKRLLKNYFIMQIDKKIKDKKRLMKLLKNDK